MVTKKAAALAVLVLALAALLLYYSRNSVANNSTPNSTITTISISGPPYIIVDSSAPKNASDYKLLLGDLPANGTGYKLTQFFVQAGSNQHIPSVLYTVTTTLQNSSAITVPNKLISVYLIAELTNSSAGALQSLQFHENLFFKLNNPNNYTLYSQNSSQNSMPKFGSAQYGYIYDPPGNPTIVAEVDFVINSTVVRVGIEELPGSAPTGLLVNITNSYLNRILKK